MAEVVQKKALLPYFHRSPLNHELVGQEKRKLGSYEKEKHITDG